MAAIAAPFQVVDRDDNTVFGSDDPVEALRKLNRVGAGHRLLKVTAEQSVVLSYGPPRPPRRRARAAAADEPVAT